MLEHITATLQRARDSAVERANSLRNRHAVPVRELDGAASRDIDLLASNASAPTPPASAAATSASAAGSGAASLPAYCYDVAVRFIGASGLPALDLDGGSDPFIVANLDDRIEYKSSVQTKTLSPVWNEQWFVKNVPETAKFTVKVFDKDNNVRDDFIGQFVTPLKQGAQEMRLDSLTGEQKGTLWFEVKLSPAMVPTCPQYTFDGPVSYSRHTSATATLVAGSMGSGLEDKEAFVAVMPDPSHLPGPISKPLNSERVKKHVYSTWKFHLKGVPIFFGDTHQHWLESYPAAQRIFTGPVLLRTSIRAAHRVLYARTTMNEFGIVRDAVDLWRELAPLERTRLAAQAESYSANPSPVPAPDPFSTTRESSPRRGGSPGRTKSTWAKPSLYTYIIGSDDMLRFSETGAKFVQDFASKHALHACCAETVRYAGEFHPRPLVEGGWAGLEGKLPPDDCEWVLWIDNASGTYGPDPALLPKLKEVIEYNFPGIKVEAFDFKNEGLAKSKSDMLSYAQSRPALAQSPSQLAETMQNIQLDAPQHVAQPQDMTAADS